MGFFILDANFAGLFLTCAHFLGEFFYIKKKNFMVASKMRRISLCPLHFSPAEYEIFFENLPSASNCFAILLGFFIIRKRSAFSNFFFVFLIFCSCFAFYKNFTQNAFAFFVKFLQNASHFVLFFAIFWKNSSNFSSGFLLFTKKFFEFFCVFYFFTKKFSEFFCVFLFLQKNSANFFVFYFL